MKNVDSNLNHQKHMFLIVLAQKCYEKARDSYRGFLCKHWVYTSKHFEIGLYMCDRYHLINLCTLKHVFLIPT